ncbi:MAG: hypothetical protein HOV80_37860 [Polyangiaceae bacterium]|nr:hypothetical protein [Polyangiaceae bacterium]
MLSGVCLVFAAVVSGCFVDALGIATDGGEGASTPSTSASATMNGDGGATSASMSSTGGLGGAGGAGGAGGGPVLVSECMGNEVAVDIVDGMLVCEALTAKINAAIDVGCDIQLGWGDQCDTGCTDPPDKQGRTSLTECQESGSDNDCRDHDLGGVSVQTFGMNLDGAVGFDDRFYTGFICDAGDDVEAPCNDDDVLVTGINGRDPVCSRATRAIYAPLRDCAFVFGWKDSCDGACVDPPQKIGSASANACTPDANSVCLDSPYDAPIDLVSFDLEGGANDDDRFFFGLTCGTATPATTKAEGSCPMGQFVNGIYEDGSFRCRSIQEISLAHFTQSCWLYAGWRDFCNGCDDPPTQWGRVRVGECMTGAVDDDACATVMFNGQNVSMFGLSPDGTVDGDDKVFVGLSCQ